MLSNKRIAIDYLCDTWFLQPWQTSTKRHIAFALRRIGDELIGGITPCIPPTANRKVQHAYDKQLYRQRHKIENLFARLKDWRRIATRYDRCAHTFMSAITIAATFCFWL